MKVLFIGDICQRILNHSKNLYLLNKNSKAIYLKSNAGIISIQDDRTEISPLSLIIKNDFLFNLSSINSEEFIINNDNILLIANNKIKRLNYKTAKIYKSKLLYTDKMMLLNICESYILDILKYKKTGGLNQYFLNKITINSFIIEYLLNFLDNMKNIIEKNGLEEISNLGKLVGSGVGLTPSYDDFLCGFLSAAKFFNIFPIDALKKNIIENLENTNLISKQYLQLSLHDRYPSPIINFYNFIIQNHTDICTIKEQFYNLGSSSGLDYSFGIYYYILIAKNFI